MPNFFRLRPIVAFTLATVFLSSCSSYDEIIEQQVDGESEQSTNQQEDSPNVENKASATESGPDTEGKEGGLYQGLSSSFPEKLERSQLIRAALWEFESFASLQNAVPKVIIRSQEGFPADRLQIFDQIIATSNSRLQFPEGAEVLVSFGMSDDFSTSTLREAGISSLPWGFPPCGKTDYESYCAGKGWAAFNFKGSVEEPKEFDNVGKKAVVAHEYFHTWQHAVDPRMEGRGYPSDTGAPLWLDEGSAQFFGFATAHSMGIEEYQEGRKQEVGNYLIDNPTLLAQHTSYETNVYGIGMVAVEYLVASAGFESLLNLYVAMGNGKSLQEAFAEEVGLTLGEFYDRFEAARSGL